MKSSQLYHRMSPHTEVFPQRGRGVASRGRGASNVSSRNRTIICFLCRASHFIRDCPHKAKTIPKGHCGVCAGSGHRATHHAKMPPNGWPYNPELQCYRCKGRGHSKRECPSQFNDSPTTQTQAYFGEYDEWQVDSGATHTLIKNIPYLEIQPTDVKLCSMTGHQIPVIGSTQIEIRKNKLRCAARMIVIDETTDISEDGILGNEFFTANNCKIDYSKNRLQIGRTHLPFESNVSFTKEKICAINKISGAKSAPLFSFSNEVFLAAVEEASTIDPFHEHIVLSS